MSIMEQQQTWRKWTNAGVEAIIATEATGEVWKAAEQLKDNDLQKQHQFIAVDANQD